MATPGQWLAGARPRTLPAAVVPVAVGTGVAVEAGDAVWWKALLALVVSLAMQVGVNYANDYSDGVRGTDDVRVGPLRLVGSKVAAPQQVKLAAFAALGVGGAAGLVLAATTTWWLLTVGIAAMAAAWGYTGGKKPYGYRALGEVSVFVFFGLVAVVGTAYVQMEKVTGLALAASIPIGMLACALLVVNNLRDAPADAEVGKRTLAVVLGDSRTRWLYTVLLFGPLLIALGLAVAHPWTVLAFAALPVAAPAVRAVRNHAAGPALIPVLGRTGMTQLAYGALLTLALCLPA
ncbi:1,4-dihydroxy-2-naphthoate polyprenyltransferase [Sporichthya polymorpha]|uniref:1,4-dihydroxy-2-naphthoate polyprenyltransferase n=1 Tax=Sporichthya polymorpha TaxID=35751 RepID=UPI00038010D5|nr:1,4-dihydroxy-2-naphthoate polyprenyltransferase [Sporichthya polymorpha]